jgi:hypothetical protein
MLTKKHGLKQALHVSVDHKWQIRQMMTWHAQPVSAAAAAASATTTSHL